MVSRIKFKSGPTPHAPGLTVDIAPVTVFVGPNNSGKSRVLLELEEWVSGARNNSGFIAEEVDFITLTREQVIEDLVKLGAFTADNAEEYLRTMFAINLKKHNKTEGHNLASLLSSVLSENPTQRDYHPVRKLLTARLDGQSRLGLLHDQRIGDLNLDSADNYLAQLFRDNPLRERVRRIVFEALGKYFVIDPTNNGMLKVKLSDRAPHSEAEERSLTGESVAFFRASTPMESVSDGVRAFIGIIATLIAGDPTTILIDEPEAFLHPALAMKLGKEVSRLVASPKRLFVSTHSAAFLMGCIQSGSPVNIIRLTYKDGVGSTRILEQTNLLHLMRNPLLRSTGVLDGLFYDAVIVTEAASDRAFYQEINERLRATVGDDRGMGNCLFINAQNKQTVWDIVKPLRELGIPAVGIVDLDMIKEGVVMMLQKAFVPPLEQQPISALAAGVRAALESVAPGSIWNDTGGISLLTGNNLSSATSLTSQLEDFGIFLVPTGQLESWLNHLGIPHEKKFWLRRMFERMGEDPTDGNYVNPGSGDVWDFIGRIKLWTNNPSRKGIPD